MKNNNEHIQSLQIKLLNVLKGSALSVMSANDVMKTPQQKLDEMDAIEQFTKYIKDYQINIKLLNTNIQEQDYII